MFIGGGTVDSWYGGLNPLHSAFLNVNRWRAKCFVDLSRLVEILHQRRSTIRDFITAFRNSTRNPLPNWACN